MPLESFFESILRRLIYFLIITIVALHISLDNYAQDRCSAVEAERLRRDAGTFLEIEKKREDWISQKVLEYRNRPKAFGTAEDKEIKKIAIVVHVIHNGEPIGIGANISDEQILSQIEVLNEDYQKKNADTVNTQEEFRSVASCMNIEFVLARQTEEGQFTNGIVRKQGTQESYGIDMADRLLLSEISQWNPEIYLNIWVTNLTSPYIGLAQFPDLEFPGLSDEPDKEDPRTDGVLIDYTVFGSIGKVPDLDLMPSYNLGRTTTHEMGHFFGLKHVWGDDTSIGGCSVDDYVSDTPMSNNNYTGLCTPDNHVSCNSNDMFENFLYYTDDACMNIFTAGQVERMNVIIDNAPRRASLYNSTGTKFPDDMFVDVGIEEIITPGKVVCSGDFAPAVRIRNNGNVAVSDFDLQYTKDDQQVIYPYEGDTLFPGNTFDMILDGENNSNGQFQIQFEVINVPNNTNTRTVRAELLYAVNDQQDFIPLRQDFESGDLALTNWIVLNDDSDITWEITETTNGSSANQSGFINLFNYESKGQSDWLISPLLDFSEAQSASLLFKTSYAKHGNFNDQLYVMAMENCSGDFDKVLRIFSSSELSVENSDNFWEPTERGDWIQQSLDLNEFAGQRDVRIAFRMVNDFGNNLYLDDIEFFATDLVDIVTTAMNSYTLYPNPTNDGQFQLSFNTSGRQTVMVSVFDQLGKTVTVNEYPNTLNQTYYYDFSTQSNGVYFIHAVGEDFMRSKKLVISK